MEDVALLVGNPAPAAPTATASAAAASGPAGIHSGPLCSVCGQAPGVFPTEAGAVCESCAAQGLAAERAEAVAAAEQRVRDAGYGWRLDQRKAKASAVEADVPLLVG